MSNQLQPLALANYIERWYEDGRRGLEHVLDTGTLEEAKIAVTRWFEMGDLRVHKVLSQLRGVSLMIVDDIDAETPENAKELMKEWFDITTQGDSGDDVDAMTHDDPEKSPQTRATYDHDRFYPKEKDA